MTEPTDRTERSAEPSPESSPEPSPESSPQPSPEASPELVEVGHACFDFARHGDTRRLLAYVAAGVPVDLTDASGNTLVMLAAYHGHADAVLGLAAAGADVDRVNDRGQTPLAGAVFKGEDDVVHALLEHGADPDRGTPSARATAQMFGRTDLIPGW